LGNALEVDVLIVGAGPAGATAALNLARTHRVMLIDSRQATDSSSAIPAGESLVPAAGRLFTDMGLFDSFLREAHAPCYGNRFVWGDPYPVETDFVRDPDGHGWHLDRRRFDVWLRRVAVHRGAILLAPARVRSAARRSSFWDVALAIADSLTAVRAHFLIDAGGRSAPLARRLGALRSTDDRLVCRWLDGSADASGQAAGFTLVEAVENGWWYTAPIPGERRILAFHTDRDPLSARMEHPFESFVESSRPTLSLAAALADCRFSPYAPLRTVAAGDGILTPFGGPGWLAAGDAALSFDPLSSQGLLNALFTGLCAAWTAAELLAGQEEALDCYVRTLHGIRDAYRIHRGHWYAEQKRWPDAPFWLRRHQVRVPH
jgi:flavin-dependent dehydrogenase